MVKHLAYRMMTFLSAFAIASNAFADPNVIQESKSTQVLGRKMGATLTAGSPEGLPQIQTSTAVTVLSKTVQPLQAVVNIPPSGDAMTVDGTTYAEYYSFNKRIFSENVSITHDGILGTKVGIAPTEVRIPVAVYPVGPLVLQIHAGARFQANLEDRLTPTIFNPASMSTLEAKLIGNAYAAAFVEGGAKLFIMRGGVGGQLDLINASTDVDSLFFFDGKSPITRMGIMAQFLKGKIYAFIDMFNLFHFGWARMWEKDFYRYPGFCFSKGNLSCPAQ